MGEESENILRKTYARSVEPVAKIGYMDGASDGQTAVFQSSFDIGYAQGFNFGLDLGFKDALLCMEGTSIMPPQQGVNCQICLNGESAQQNVGNLYNLQKERNTEYLLNYSKTYLDFFNDKE